ncbi:unnamed protein product [Psylliodes chrysocephalus]|uniref:Uncharacterized protein n=1 Tax=Psylliodes chrysocephalus TaxID=3402493 RepID=A0A9P0GHN1_9CUCU|nr:unnamed protein product [Psylliodes chrysocephala]
MPEWGIHELAGVRLPLQPYPGGHAVFMYSTASDGNVTLQLKEPDDLDRNSLAAMLAKLQDDATFSISYQDTDILSEGIDVLLGTGTANSGYSSTFNRVTETSALDSDQLHNIPTASCSTTAQIEAESNIDVSFEKLLLATMKNHTSYEKVKKKRVCPGAEVITNDGAIQRLKDNEIKMKVKLQTAKKKNKKIQN